MKITNPEDRARLKPRVLRAWARRGRYMREVHDWAFAPDPAWLIEGDVAATEARVLYLLAELELETQSEGDGVLHPEVQAWRSAMLLFVNQIHGGSVPRLRSDHWRDGFDAAAVRPTDPEPSSS